MAGHSKWKNNLHRKSAQDAKRSKNFAKLSRLLTMCVIEGGNADPAFNPKLRMMIEKARAASMPKDNIERAIAKGSGPDKESLQHLTLELIGPSGVALIVSAMTDNVNRTLGEARSIADRHGAKVAQPGAVMYNFTHPAAVVVHGGEEEVFALAEKLDAIDIEPDTESGDSIIYFPFEQLGKSPDILAQSPVKIVAQPEAIYQATTTIEVSDEDRKRIEELVNALEDNEDIQSVYTNG